MRRLLERARTGDSQALEEIFRLTVTDVYRIVLARTQDPDLTEDAIQDAYVHAFTRLDQLKNPDRIVPWLASIAMSHYRSHANERKRQIPFSSVRAALHRREPRVYRISELPYERAVANEGLTRILSLIEALPPEYREVFLLRYLADCTYSEIEEILELPRGTVKSRISRATRYFRELWEDRYDPLRRIVAGDG